MARKEQTFTAADGRDEGKQFKITEMPASQAERWAIRVILAMGKAGISVPDNLAEQGMAGLAILGLYNLPKMGWADAEPLLDEMMGCVKRIESAGTRDLVENDIEEVKTRFALRKAILDLHLDFFAPAAESTSGSVAAAPAATNTSTIKTRPRP